MLGCGSTHIKSSYADTCVTYMIYIWHEMYDISAAITVSNADTGHPALLLETILEREKNFPTEINLNNCLAWSLDLVGNKLAMIWRINLFQTFVNRENMLSIGHWDILTKHNCFQLTGSNVFWPKDLWILDKLKCFKTHFDIFRKGRSRWVIWDQFWPAVELGLNYLS